MHLAYKYFHNYFLSDLTVGKHKYLRIILYALFINYNASENDFLFSLYLKSYLFTLVILN